MSGKARLQRVDDGRRVVDRQRRLRDVGELRRDRATASRSTSSTDLDEVHAAVALAHRALDLRVARVADHHDLAALLAHLGDLDVHLGDQRAGRVEHLEPARVGFARAPPATRRARENTTVLPAGTSASSSTNTAPFALQVVDDELVVHDLVAHVDRRAELRERLLDDRDGAIDAGAEAARIGEQDVHHRRSFAVARRRSRVRWRKLSRISSAAPTVIALSATLNAGHVPAARSGTAGSRRPGRARAGPRGCRARRPGSARGRRSTSAAAAAPQQPDDHDAAATIAIAGEEPALPAGARRRGS